MLARACVCVGGGVCGCILHLCLGQCVCLYCHSRDRKKIFLTSKDKNKVLKYVLLH